MGVVRLEAELGRRNVGEELRTFTKTFTSFDKCMSRNICKIPFIVGCIVLGLILIVFVTCLLRCIICGYACCSCCCGGCGGRQKKVKKVEISPPGPMAVRQSYSAPQYAYFDSKSDDALPAMPTLDKAMVEVEVKEVHEMSPVRQAQKPLAPANPLADPREIQRSPSPSEYTDVDPPGPENLYTTGPPRRGPGPPVGGGYRPGPRPQLPPGPGFLEQRNTIQRAYATDVPVNPFQYQGPRQPMERLLPNDPSAARKPQEWSVI